MHPMRGERRRLLVYLFVWQLLGLLLTLGLREDASWVVAAAFFLPLSTVYAFVCLTAWYVCRAFPMDAVANIWNFLLGHVAAAAIASLLLLVSGLGWALTLDTFAPLGAWQLFERQRILLFVLGTLLFWLATASLYLLIAFQASRDAETRAIELNLLAREAELRALRAQIDPHFLFNSLQSISALTTVDPAAARRMCLLLADFLRETLALGARARIPLSAELALVRKFLSIEQVRFGPRLQVEIDPGEASDVPVPPLLLQPLAENAVTHGIAHLLDGGVVRIRAERRTASLAVTVDNPVDADRPAGRGTGLGLRNVRERLANAYGADAFAHAEEHDGTYTVRVELPL